MALFRAWGVIDYGRSLLRVAAISCGLAAAYGAIYRIFPHFLDYRDSANVDLLNDPGLWNSAPIEPKTPPNPLKNDKEFLADFPYLADPW